MKRLSAVARLYAYDMRCGISSVAPRLAIVTLLAALCSLMFYLYASAAPSASCTLNYATYIAAVFGGSSEFIPERGEGFSLPAAWLCNCLAITFVTLDYPSTNLKSVGTMALVLSGSRWSWWISKCLWVGTCCLLGYVASLSGCLLCALGVGASPGLGLSKEAAELLGFFMASASPLARETADISEFLACAPVVLISISLIQLAISMHTAPYIGLVASICAFFASSFWLNCILLGNHLMIARSDLTIANGVPAEWGAAIACLFALLAVVIGGLLFNRRSIHARERDAS